MANDSDTFVRWEAAQLLATNAIFAQRDRLAQGDAPELPDTLKAAVASMLEDEESDPALLGEALKLPSEEYLAELVEVVDVDGIHDAREYINRALAVSLENQFRHCYQRMCDGAAYNNSPEAIGRRILKNVCLSYIANIDGGDELAAEQLASSDNMTDTLAAISALVYSGSPKAAQALSEFEARWNKNALVMDKWFSIQAANPSAVTVDDLPGLMEHPAFSLKNPNKVRSLIGIFALCNPTGFHAADGRGYQFLADQVIVLDRLNPQVAARMVSAFNAWKRYDKSRQNLMSEQLRRILSQPKLSPDVSEIVSNALSED